MSKKEVRYLDSIRLLSLERAARLFIVEEKKLPSSKWSFECKQIVVSVHSCDRYLILGVRRVRLIRDSESG